MNEKCVKSRTEVAENLSKEIRDAANDWSIRRRPTSAEGARCATRL